MRPGTILVVDDEASVRRTTRRALEYCGYTVLEAGDGIEGLELYHKERDRISLVVLDVVMPEMSGWEVLAELKTAEPSMPVVLISGYAWTGQTPAHNAVRADAFIRKPFELAELADTVRRLLADTPDAEPTP